jgi:hypothetical protein
LVEAWHYDYYGPSGASPLVIGNVLYFDATNSGSSTDDTLLYALQDNGTSASLLFSVDISTTNRITAAFAQDPRGGFWSFPFTQQYMCLRSATDGSLLDTLDINALIQPGGGAHTYYPSSATCITGSSTNPVMVIEAQTSTLSDTAYILAIDLPTDTLLWKLALPSSGRALGQFPILEPSGMAPRIVFTQPANGLQIIEGTSQWP